MVEWQGLTNGASWSYAPVATDGINIVRGRIMANGQGPVIINALHCYAGGYGGTRTFTATLGAASGRFSKGAGQASDSGWFRTNDWVVPNGGTTTFSIGSDGNGAFYFGKGDSGSTRNLSTGYVWGGGLAGGYGYIQGPAAPTITSAVPSPSVAGNIDIVFRGGDVGGGAIRTYGVWRNGVLIANNLSGTFYDTGRVPGNTYEYWITAYSNVTDAVGTYSQHSNHVSIIAPGNPYAPRSLAASASPTVYGQVTLTWLPPSVVTHGAITGYDILDKGVAVASVAGNTTTWVGNNLGNNVSHTYTVKARNAFSDRNRQSGVASNAVTVVSPGPPSAPQNLTGVASTTIAGQITLNWTAPSDLAGGVTRYSVYQGAANTLLGYTTAQTYQINDLVPGTSYSFYVRAWNDAADIAGTPGPASNTVLVSATGEPPAPIALAATPNPLVAGRLLLTWQNPGGVVTGYNIYQRVGTTYVRVATSTKTSVNIDNLTPGAEYSFVISARNAVTDIKGVDGPKSNAIVGVPGSTTTQTVDNVAVSNSTNVAFAGQYKIVSATANTMTYIKTAPNVTSAVVPAGATVTDTSNVAVNGTYTIASTPTVDTFTFPKTTPNLGETSALGGNVVDTTNQIFNGTYTVKAVDVPNKRVTYSKINANIGVREATGTITNTTNAAFNGSGLTISALTPDTISYNAPSSFSDVNETVSTGNITNVTNRDVFNGVKTISRTPEYNTIAYSVTSPNYFESALLEPYGGVKRSVSPALLRVSYRSGWAG